MKDRKDEPGAQHTTAFYQDYQEISFPRENRLRTIEQAHGKQVRVSLLMIQRSTAVCQLLSGPETGHFVETLLTAGPFFQ
jgi:hypothetical protein